MTNQLPRTMAFSYHLKLFVKARWLAVAMSSLGVMVAQFWFELCFVYTALYSIIGAIALYNVGFWFILRNYDFHENQCCESMVGSEGWRRGRFIAWLQILFDLIALFWMLHFSGGLENPFVIFFMLHMVMATLLLEPAGTMLVAIVITAFVFALGITEKTGILAHYHPDKVYGDYEPLNSWVFVLVMPSIILLMNICLTGLTYFMMRAINERRNTIIILSRELEEKNRRLVMLDNRRKQTMAVVSHDLKSPIDAVNSYLIMMQEGYLGDFSDKQMEIIKKCYSRLKRLREFVSDVLDWQTIERGDVQEVMAPTQLVDVLRESYAEYEDTAKAKGISFKLSIADKMPLVNADPRRMFQVFDNLISNAVKYTLAGGSVEVASAVEEGQLLFRVSDSGIGMTDDEMSHLFEDFYRSPNVKKKFEGTGLGLTVVDRIVRAHHGRVWAESEAGKGTTFFVSIPIGRLSQPPRG
ncbi:MAG: HAMP domain-containing histidine kinase [Deltaproteobacteria bacterium]|nr:HAMP domain-containing histidine kinase [Deltaproteobacteria bacterium]